MPRRENGRLGREKSPLDNFCDPFNFGSARQWSPARLRMCQELQRGKGRTRKSEEIHAYTQ